MDDTLELGNTPNGCVCVVVGGCLLVALADVLAALIYTLGAHAP